MNNKMKQDWVECTLGDFIQHRGESLNPKNHLDETFELYSIPNHAIKKPEVKLGKEIGSSKQIVGNNWVLLSRINPHLNRSWVIKSDSELTKIASSEWVKFPPNDALNPEFIGFFLTKTELKNYMCLNVSGVGGSLTRTNKNAISIFKLSLPPLIEQKAIVTKIEELFSSLDRGIADLKKAQDQLKIYRQAVLKKAFEGEHKIEKLGKVAEVKRGKSKHRPRNDKSLFGGKYPFIQTGEIRAASGGVITKYTNTYSEKGLAQSKLWPKGTLCLTIAANIGETAFLWFDACFPDSVVGIKPNDDLLKSKYLNFYIQKIKEEMDSKASATAQKNINVRILDALEIPIPSLQEQHQIVREIESRLSVTDNLEFVIRNSIEKAQALRQSILKKAFEGTLLSEQEIAQCKAHPDYEPASILLERMRAEKKKK